jgi:hypothetical protein
VSGLASAPGIYLSVVFALALVAVWHWTERPQGSPAADRSRPLADETAAR